MKTVKGAMALVCMMICFMAGLAFSGCSHGSSDSESDSGNPFAGTEWSSDNTSLKFYSDGTFSDGKNNANELRYRVASDGDSYTATLYVEAHGVRQDMATLTISSAGASSGQYRLSGSNYPAVTLKKVGESSNGGSSSSDGEGSNGTSNGNGSNSSYEGTKGGEAGDQFSGTTWSSSSCELYFGSYDGTVRYQNSGYDYYYDYYFKTSGGSYIATAYDQASHSKMFTFSFTLADPSIGNLCIGSDSYGTNLKRNSSNEYEDSY